MDARKKLVGKLTTAKRNKLPAKEFGLPGQRAYPENDPKHAALAKAFAKKELKQGHLTDSQYNQIVTKANRELAQA